MPEKMRQVRAAAQSRQESAEEQRLRAIDEARYLRRLQALEVELLLRSVTEPDSVIDLLVMADGVVELVDAIARGEMCVPTVVV